jgi:hypothetical protein
LNQLPKHGFVERTVAPEWGDQGRAASSEHFVSPSNDQSKPQKVSPVQARTRCFAPN